MVLCRMWWGAEREGSRVMPRVLAWATGRYCALSRQDEVIHDFFYPCVCMSHSIEFLEFALLKFLVK